jgi:Uma2 family endonuclease
MAANLSPTLEQSIQAESPSEKHNGPQTEIERSKFEAGEPVWEIAHLFPNQGQWSEEDYLELDTNHLIEYSHGFIEVLEMPTEFHQDLVFMLAQLLARFVKARNLGKVLLAPLRVKVGLNKYREPDVVFMLKEHSQRRNDKYWDGADLVMEVLSPDDRNRDLVKKRREYAWAGIPEYWLIDPEYRTITVLSLSEQHYVVHGEFTLGEQATSRLLEGFTVDLTALFTPEE